MHTWSKPSARSSPVACAALIERKRHYRDGFIFACSSNLQRAEPGIVCLQSHGAHSAGLSSLVQAYHIPSTASLIRASRHLAHYEMHRDTYYFISGVHQDNTSDEAHINCIRPLSSREPTFTTTTRKRVTTQTNSSRYFRMTKLSTPQRDAVSGEDTLRLRSHGASRLPVSGGQVYMHHLLAPHPRPGPESWTVRRLQRRLQQQMFSTAIVAFYGQSCQCD